MPKVTKKTTDNLFQEDKKETPTEQVGYSEEQENQDLVQLGILKVDDVVLAEPTDPNLPTVDDVFATIDEQKKMVSVWKNQLALVSDRSKLKRLKMIINLNEKLIGKISDDDFIQRIIDGTNTGLEFKFIIDSVLNLTKESQNLMRLDSVNESGDAGALAIQLTTASGTEIKIAAK
jgi:hypothetical protein